jgi:hypothetical protein
MPGAPSWTTVSNVRACAARHIALAAALTVAIAVGLSPTALAAGWTAPATVSTATDVSSAEAVSAVAPDGTLAVAWVQGTGANAVVQASVRPAGGTFTAPQTLSPAAADLSNLAVAIDGSGNTTVVWLTAQRVRASYRPAGGAWPATPQTLSSVNSTFPSVAAGPRGGAIAVWVQTSGSNKVAAGAIRPIGATTFGSPTTVSPEGRTIYYNPRAAMDDAGDVAVTWQREFAPNGDGNYIYVAEATVKAVDQPTFPTSGPGFVELSSTAPSNGNGAGSSVFGIAMTHRGDVTAMWDYSDGSPGGTATYYRQRPVGASFASSAWGVSVQASPLNRYAPRFALDDAGEILATWTSSDTSTAFGGIRPALGAFSEQPLSGVGVANQSIATSPAGDAIVVWRAPEDNGTIVASRRPRGQTTFGSPQPLAKGDLAATPATTTFGASVGVDDQGNAFVVYTATSGSKPSRAVQYRVFDNAAPSLGSVVIPPSAASGAAVSFSAAASDRVSGASLHWDFGDGSSADGARVDHAFAGPRTATVTVTATDGVGNATSSSGVVTVAAAPASPIGSAPAPGVAKLPALPATVTSTLSVSKSKTRFKKLTVKGVVKGDTIKIGCSTTKLGCKKSTARTITLKTVKKSGRSLLDEVGKLRLKSGAVLTLTIARPGYASKVVTFAIAKKKKDTKTSTQCVTPGIAAPYAC